MEGRRKKVGKPKRFYTSAQALRRRQRRYEASRVFGNVPRF